MNFCCICKIETNNNARRCFSCNQIYMKNYYNKNKEKILKKEREKREKNPEIHRNKNKQYRKLNHEKVKIQKKKEYEKHKEQYKNYKHNYYLKNIEIIKEKQKKYRNIFNIKRKEKYKNDLNYKLINIIRSRLRITLKNQKAKKQRKTIEYLGCDIIYLIKYLESKFQPGMTWENYNYYGWHIDHIIPLSSFDLTDEKELKKACHYTNLQPLWAKDNFRKSDTITKGN